MVKCNEMARAYRLDPQRTLDDLREAFRRGHEGAPGGLKPDEISLRDLAAATVCDAQTGEPLGLAGLEAWCRGRLLESGSLTTGAFTTLTGVVINAAVREGYALPEFVLSSVVPVINGRARQARIVGVSLPLRENKALEIGEGQEYPAVGMYDEYSRTHDARKIGAVVRVTKEAVLQDDTGLILDQARRVGELIGLQKEILLTDYVIGAVNDCVIERKVGDAGETTGNLFLTTGRYVNSQANPLNDWTDIDDAEALILGITMPGTGQPPILTQRYVLVPPQRRSLATRILQATETRSGTSNIVVAANPLAGLGLRLVSSPLVYTRAVAAGVSAGEAAGRWFYGDLAAAVRWYQNWDLTVEQETTGHLAFTHDVVAQFKASIRGIPVIVEPRVWTRNTTS